MAVIQSTVRQLYFIVLFYFAWIALPTACPNECDCSYINGTTNLMVNCSGLGISYIPGNIPEETYFLDLSSNDFSNFSDSDLTHLASLHTIDLRQNSRLGELPFFYKNVRMRNVYVDSGHTCCIYEIEYDGGKAVEGSSPPHCIATDPYTECSENLLKVFTIVIYTIVVIFSFIFNPWIMVVTMGLRRRREDPITFNAFHFSMANLLTTIYAAVMLGKGINFHGSYHYHMADWLTDPGCSVVGCMLLVATVVSACLYMIEVICMFMKLRFPLKIERHITIRRLNFTVLGTWIFALFIGIIPFMSKRTYNAVGLCVPFYNDGILPFKYVIFYTCIMAATVVVNTALAVALIRSFMRNRRIRHDEMPSQLMRDLLSVEKMILIGLCVYIGIAVINVTFLILSCVGGHVGKVGREWYTRMIVLETITYPLVGPIRRKKFYKDTIRLLQKWHCIDSYEDEHSSTATRFLLRSSTRRTQTTKLAGSSFNTGGTSGQHSSHGH